MTDCILVQTSLKTQEEAQRMAEALVKQRLAACCWISGPIQSTYWWKGKVEQDTEFVCSFKTRLDAYSALEQAIKALHPYEIPEIVATPIIAGSQNFLDWIRNETRPH